MMAVSVMVATVRSDLTVAVLAMVGNHEGCESDHGNVCQRQSRAAPLFAPLRRPAKYFWSFCTFGIDTARMYG